MSKEIKITYFRVDGKGPTLTAATKDAGRQIEMMLKGDCERKAPVSIL
jgi:hypothetical protein